MKVVAVVGVSGSGKTTLTEDFRKVIDDKCEVMEETTRGELLEYLGFPLNFNPKKESTNRIARYDFGRVEHQIIEEKKFIEKYSQEDKILFIDKAAPCLLVYALTMSARFAGLNLDAIIRELIEHSNLYNTVIFLPYVNFDVSKDGLQRNVTNQYVLEAQDAVLGRIVRWLSADIYFAPYFGRRARYHQAMKHLLATGVVAEKNGFAHNI